MGQLVDKSEFDRLVIVDEFNSNYNIIFGRVYKINLHDSLPQLILYNEYKSPDTLADFYKNFIPNFDQIQNNENKKIIGQINSEKIDDFIEVLNQPKGLSDLLEFYQIDSTWYLKNKDRIIEKWLANNTKLDKLEKEYGKYILNDFEKFRIMAYRHILQSNTSGYSSVTVAFENDTDTLIIHSTGQESFLIPWLSGTTYKNYDPNLSALVSQFLPSDIIINKNTLNPTIEDFEDRILQQLTFKVGFVNRKKFKKLLKEKSR
ncbi:hypothetical protein OO013_18230 [Mangrovivirga sp. M17]|uniref:Uncharacterized protein n=1 Tax=Mangrovivirga halotolerans TaxID=2993936 RepID=A0ABT3RVN1_9BACT|nr:hypothetical protein [Mangrovivirga halotolerans]MCX2745826.1 hypothetical protein [Mangrovivirga halotolerans]